MNDFLNSIALRWGRIKYHWGKLGEIFPLHPWGLAGENIPFKSDRQGGNMPCLLLEIDREKPQSIPPSIEKGYFLQPIPLAFPTVAYYSAS